MSLGWLLLIQYGTAATALLTFSAARHGLLAAAAATSPTGPANQGAGAAQSHSAAGLIGVVGLTGTISLQYLAFSLAPIVAANVLTYGWPLLAAGWLAATLRSRQALHSAALAVIGFGGVALIFTSPTQASTDTAATSDATWG